MRYLSIIKHFTSSTSKSIPTVGLLMAVCAALLVMLAPEPLQQLNRMSYDLMLRRLGEKPPNANVLIVDVDEPSVPCG